MIRLILLLTLTSGVYAKEALKINFDKDFKCKTEDQNSRYCHNKKENIVINITQTDRGQFDDINRYRTYLSKKKVIGPFVSKPISTNQIRIKKQKWIQSKHFESELPGHHTIYFAAPIKSQAFLISFSYPGNNKALETKYIELVKSKLEKLK